LVSLEFERLDFSRPNFKNLSQNLKLRRIEFKNCSITDDSLQSFPGHPKLFSLSFSSCALNGTGFSFIKDCPTLCVLRLRWNELTQEGIKVIANPLRVSLLN
jgi:hypothetical protein